MISELSNTQLCIGQTIETQGSLYDTDFYGSSAIFSV